MCHKGPKVEVGDRVRITKYKKITSKAYTKNWWRKIFVIDSVIKNNLWTNKIKDLSKDKILNGDGDDDKKIPDIMD